jgi:hypothetical protein
LVEADVRAYTELPRLGSSELQLLRNCVPNKEPTNTI